jgi:hypothetical protein
MGPYPILSDSFYRLEFSHLGGTGIDTLLSPLHRKLRSRCLHLPPTMVIGFLAPFMQLFWKRLANTTPGI